MGGGRGYAVVSCSASEGLQGEGTGTACDPTENISSMVERREQKQLELHTDTVQGDAHGEALRR
jgi:hypothetical protein